MSETYSMDPMPQRRDPEPQQIYWKYIAWAMICLVVFYQADFSRFSEHVRPVASFLISKGKELVVKARHQSAENSTLRRNATPVPLELDPCLESWHGVSEPIEIEWLSVPSTGSTRARTLGPCPTPPGG